MDDKTKKKKSEKKTLIKTKYIKKTGMTKPKGKASRKNLDNLLNFHFQRDLTQPLAPTFGGGGNKSKKKEPKVTKTKTKDKLGNVTKTKTKGNKTKSVTRVEKVYATNAVPLSDNPVVKRKGKKRYVTKTKGKKPIV